MKKQDFIWGILLCIIIFFMVSPYTGNIYKEIVSDYPYLVGFIKFFILATMGELLANRIIFNKWEKTKGMIYKAIMWGFYGMLITLMFQVFAGGVEVSIANGYLPKGEVIVFAFLASLLMNFFFAPVMMGMHKVTDAYIDMFIDEGIANVNLKRAIESIDWVGFINFIVLKTIPLFWVPAHTISFLLPVSLRTTLAALLSIAFGVIMAYSKVKKLNKVLN